MLYKLTRFDNVRTTVGSPLELSIGNLADLLTADPLVNGGSKLDAPAFTPGWFVDNQRNKKSFQTASCLVLDVDGPDHGALSDSQLLSVLEFLKNQQYVYVLYTTFNAGLRIVYPLAEEISAQQYTELYDQISETCPVAVDKTGRSAERVHFLPQVPDNMAKARHIAEFCSDGRLLSSGRGTTSAKPSSMFAGLKLSDVRLSKAVLTLDELTEALAVSTSKQEDLNKFCFSLACDAARRSEDKQPFALQLWSAAEDGLQRNATPVENWRLALDTVERAVEQAYTKITQEHDIAARAVPKQVNAAVEKLINDGYIAAAGAAIGKYVSATLTPAVLVQRLTSNVETSQGIVSIPDALAELRSAICAAQPTDWQTGLSLDEKGNWASHDQNIDHVLNTHPDVRGKIQRDVRSIVGYSYADAMPWGTPAGEVENQAADERSFFSWIVQTLTCGKNTGAASLPAVRAGNRLYAAFAAAPTVDPFEAWLNDLQWDGTPRLDSWLRQHCEAEDNEYTRSVGRMWLVGACARTFVPGCQMDTALVFVNPRQGVGKSTAILSLLPNANSWGGTLKLDEKELPLKMHRYVIGIVEEVDKLSGKKVASEMKEFVTERVRHARLPYARTESPLPRRAVILGTSNHEDFLHDETGARRWWAVNVGIINREALAAVRDQLWAEAVAAYRAGESWWFTLDQQDTVAAPQQQALTTPESSPEAEHLLDAMRYTPPAARYDGRSKPPMSTEGKIPVYENQLDGDRLLWVTLRQVAIILKNGQFHNDDKTVKSALKRARLKRNKKNDRYSTCGKL